ncbi:hypothetical protein QFC21_001998 [Naganishia friedmannii]|uniref:Uncharacterized protein n=1 Tax=Naganishia friedmannii TaxID=89922 RepID=A0ACC2W063_9TREE|nr:hypothetical protein QFC21_001998 [Naganishia friedmannii]
MAAGEERVDVDSLEKGQQKYPPGSYIGGELIVLNAKAASEPLVFHLSTKSRQGRSNLIIQCGKFPAQLNGNSVLEEAYSFLESRFRQYIRIQADFEGLEVLDVVATKGKPKRIDIRYGVGGAILAQDGGVVHIVTDSVASWFPSQNSTDEADTQQSGGEHAATKTPPAAQNSPLAAFPTSPPTSEPPMPVEQRKLDVSNQSRVRKLQSRAVDLPLGGSSNKKVKIERVSVSSALPSDFPDTNSKSVSHDRKSVTRVQPNAAVSDGASPRVKAFDSAAEDQPVFTTKGFRISQLLADPTLLGQLWFHQREALRKAAEQKWLQRNPLFAPAVVDAEVDSELPIAQKSQHPSGSRSTEVTTPVISVPTTNAQSSRHIGTEDNLSALAAEGGLVVPRTQTTSKLVYTSVERMYSLQSDLSPLVNTIALVQDTRGPRGIGQRGDILYRFRLVDPSRPHEGPWLSLFTRDEERRLPPNISPGSVLLVRGAKVSHSVVSKLADRLINLFYEFQLHRDNRVDLKCPAHADWTYSLLIRDTFGNSKYIEGVGKRHMDTPPLSRIEMDKMSELQRWYFAKYPALQGAQASGNNAVGKLQTTSTSKRARTWGSVSDRDFCDMTVEILHVRQALYPTKREFIVTDYTKNDRFTFNEYSTAEIPEVGFITLLTLWDAVALSADLNVINDGDIVTFLNVAIKGSSTRYGIEGNVREGTGLDGIQYRRFRVLNPQTDAQAAELIRRRERLKAETLERQRSETIPVALQSHVSSTLNHHPLSVSESILATFKTRYSTQPFSSITEILHNPVPDNRFRLRAWVCKIQTRTLGAQGEESKNLRDLVVRRCKTCDRYFEQKYCVWCKTMLSNNLEYQYLFVIHLKEDSKEKTETLPAIVSSKYMSNVLPSLPAVSLLGVDEEKELMTACRQVEEMLQGRVVNGTRQCPVIDWSLSRLSTGGKSSNEGIFASGMQRTSPNMDGMMRMR